MVQQLIREGNIRSLFLNASPIGLIARTTWRLPRTRSMKKLYIANGVASIFLPWNKKNESFNISYVPWIPESLAKVIPGYIFFTAAEAGSLITISGMKHVLKIYHTHKFLIRTQRTRLI